MCVYMVSCPPLCSKLTVCAWYPLAVMSWKLVKIPSVVTHSEGHCGWVRGWRTGRCLLMHRQGWVWESDDLTSISVEDSITLVVLFVI